MLHSSTTVEAILKMTVFSLNVLIVFLVFAQNRLRVHARTASMKRS